jgi:hypothetical protein
MLFDKCGRDTDQDRHKPGKRKHFPVMRELTGVQYGQMNGNRTRYMDGRAHIAGRVNHADETYNLRAEIRRGNLPSQVEAVRPDRVDEQADRRSAEHDKAKPQITVLIGKHEPDHEHRHPRVPEKIWNDEIFTERNHVIQRTVHDVARLRCNQLQNEKSGKKYEHIETGKTVPVSVDPLFDICKHNVLSK